MFGKSTIYRLTAKAPVQRKTVAIVGLIACGLGGALYYNLVPASQNMAAALPEQRPLVEQKPLLNSRGFTLTGNTFSAPPKTTAYPLEIIRLGDHALLGGNSLGAYQHYQEVAEEQADAHEGSLDIRLGLAAELAGRLDQAEFHYRTAISSPEGKARDQCWGLLGTARIWEAQSRYEEAIGLLSELLLMFSSELYPRELRMQVMRQLASCEQRLCLQQQDSSSDLPDSPLYYHWPLNSLETMLGDELTFPPSPLPGDQGLVVEVVQKPANDLRSILVTVHASAAPVIALLDQLAKLGEHNIVFDPEVRMRLAGRTVQVQVTALPISILVDRILAPQSMLWTSSDNTLRIQHSSEMTDEKLQATTLSRLQRLLQLFEVDSPTGPERTAALMHLGNNLLLLGDLDSAEDRYASAREQQPTGELNAMLCFNSALLMHRRGQRATALNLYYMALDQTLLLPMQALAYQNIAELELELGRLNSAAEAASRALHLSENRGSRSRIALNLAQAQLLLGEPAAANQTLFEHSHAFSSEAERRLASAVAAYARFQAAKPRHGLQDSGQRLVTALACIEPQSFQGSVIDHLILAQAFEKVGFRSHAIALLTAAMSQSQERFLLQHINLELARLHLRNGNWRETLDVLESVETQADIYLTREKLLLKAQTYRMAGQVAFSEEICQQLLQEALPDEDKAEVLRLLAGLYQDAGSHYAAALCYAGMLPQPQLEDPELEAVENYGVASP
ncbi:MAG: hypothetical protein NXI32_16515 [bacterium]|nr:hypothetical protein [bacterium]